MKSETVKHFFSNWPLQRLLGLAAGLFFMYQAIWYQEAIPAFLGAFFLFQAITNTGCLGSRSCAVPGPNSSNSVKNEITDIEFTEIKEE